MPEPFFMEEVMEQSWWKRLWKTLCDEQGQIPASPDSESPEPDPAGTNTPPEPAPTETPGQAPPEIQDSFFDPKALAPELQKQWKSMQAAYTKKMQHFARTRDQAELVERFNSDPAFRRQTLLQYAHELGVPVQPGQPAPT